MLVAAPGEYASCHENELKRYEKPGTCSCSEALVLCISHLGLGLRGKRPKVSLVTAFSREQH